MQSRSLSALETVTSTAAGFLVSLALTFTVLPAFGYAVTAPHAWGITLIYTAASLLRGYAVRRAFNANA
jgi:polyferredoxin